MPSIINTNAFFSSGPSEQDLLSGSVTSTTTSTFHSNNNSGDNIQELKDRQRRRRMWLEPEDEVCLVVLAENNTVATL
jgi:hypothetical protein